MTCWAYICTAQVQSDTLQQTLLTKDSLSTAEADSTILSVSADSVITVDSISITDSISVADSILVTPITDDSAAIALRPLIKVDSTALIMEKVKNVTNMISEQSFLNTQRVRDVFSDTAIVNKYNRLLDKMVREYATAIDNISVEDSSLVSPYYFRLFAPLTLYKSPVSAAIGLERADSITLEDSLRQASMSSGRDLRLINELDRILLSTYLATPDKVIMTEDELKSSQSLSEETIKSATENAGFNVPTTIVSPIADTEKANITTQMVVHKPNFWKTLGNFSAQMTESFFSPNWYQGGTNNVNVVSSIRFEANYNNKKKTQWDNKLEARVGFYKNYREGETEPIQSNQDMLRLTSKLNLKAIRNWNYTVEAQGETQMMQHFNNNNTLKSRFMTPFNGSLTVGMDFKKNFKKGSISIFPGPLSYKMSYVAVKELAKNYGIEEGKVFRNDIGSKLEVNFNYKFTKSISYRTRFYYYTPYDYVQMDWENTLDFQVSKYLSAKIFFHARFDDHVARNDKWGYLQFKEYLTFGLNYSW